MYRQFRMLYDKGDDSAFYQHAHAFEEYLKSTNDWKSYYKTKTNEGFYDIKQKNLFRAIVTAQYLDSDARKNKDVEYYYLATALMGNIYRASHDTRRAEEYFVQALNEVDDRDPKFTMVTLRDLAQLLCIKEPARAIVRRPSNCMSSSSMATRRISRTPIGSMSNCGSKAIRHSTTSMTIWWRLPVSPSTATTRQPSTS